MTGTFLMTADRKGRACLPSVWFPTSERVVLAAFPERTLIGMPAHRWPRLGERWRETLCETAHVRTMNAENRRVQIPAQLQAWIGLVPGTDLALTGMGEVFLIQAAAQFETRLTERMARLWKAHR